MIVAKKLVDRKNYGQVISYGENDEYDIKWNFNSYGNLYVDFLAGELSNLVRRDNCIDIFHNVDLYRNEFDKLHKAMS